MNAIDEFQGGLHKTKGKGSSRQQKNDGSASGKVAWEAWDIDTAAQFCGRTFTVGRPGDATLTIASWLRTAIKIKVVTLIANPSRHLTLFARFLWLLLTDDTINTAGPWILLLMNSGFFVVCGVWVFLFYCRKILLGRLLQHSFCYEVKIIDTGFTLLLRWLPLRKLNLNVRNFQLLSLHHLWF